MIQRRHRADPLPSGARSALRFETISTESAFAELEEPWDELVRTMPRPSPFLLHRWLLEWWRHYGIDAALDVHVAYRGSRLVGALPLCRRKRLGLAVTEFLGGKEAALADVMVSPEERAAAQGLAERLAETRHDYADLFGLPADSRLAAALPTGALRLVRRLDCPVLDLSDGWEPVYRAKASKKSRSERRRRRRQLEEQGAVDVSTARSRDDLRPMLEEAFRLHALRWRGRRDSSDFVTTSGRHFHRAALLALAELDVPRLASVSLDGRPVAFALSLQFAGTLYGLRMGFDPAYARFSPGSEALFTCLENAAADGAVRVEFLGSATDYKRRFADRLEPIYEGLGLARTVRGRAAVDGLIAGISLRRVLKRSRAAVWLYDRVPRRVS